MTDEKMPRRAFLDHNGLWHREQCEGDKPYILATDHDKLRELARAVVDGNWQWQDREALRAHLDATEKEG